MLAPCSRAGVASNLGVENEKARLQFGSVGTDGRTVPLQKLATLSVSADAALPQCCVAQHVPDRHPGRLQTAEKLDPGQDRCVVIPMARLVAVSIGQQPDPLIVTNRMCCQSRAFRQFTNLHEHPSRSTTQRKLRVRVRSKSRGNRSTVLRAPAPCLRLAGHPVRCGRAVFTAYRIIRSSAQLRTRRMMTVVARLMASQIAKILAFTVV